MSKINNPLQIYKLLPGLNCRHCNLRTCLAFADAVIKGRKKINDCPYLEKDVIDQLNDRIAKPMSIEEHQELMLYQLKKEITGIDYSSSTERLGCSFSNGDLIIKSLGKDFIVDAKGNISSDCHVNTWITIPLLNYIIVSKGKDVCGKWVPFRELKNGKERQPLFEQRCGKPLRQIADEHPNLFKNVIYIFSGKPITNSYSSDISLILHPLPKVPILINYSKPQESFDSKLNIFFDTTAEDNLNIESIHMLCSGLVMMFEKIALMHG